MPNLDPERKIDKKRSKKKPKESQLTLPKESQLILPKESQLILPKESQLILPKESQLILPKESQLILPKESQLILPKTVKIFLQLHSDPIPTVSELEVQTDPENRLVVLNRLRDRGLHLVPQELCLLVTPLEPQKGLLHVYCFEHFGDCLWVNIVRLNVYGLQGFVDL